MIAKDDGKEFYIFNLETLHTDEKSIKAGADYGMLVLSMLLKRGSFPIYFGTYFNDVIGSYGSSSGISRVAVARYRSLRDLLDMNADPKMIVGAELKFEALMHTEAFSTKPIFSATSIRISVGLILIVFGLIVSRL